MEQALEQYKESGPLSVHDMKVQIQTIQHMLDQVMKKDVHYGVIPGCGDKPTLLKAGAEKISLTFRLAPSYHVSEKNLPNGHREYRVTCVLTHIPSGQIFGEGLGICTTMEGKYRFRNDVEWTGENVPKKYWDKRDPSLLGGKGHFAKKNDNGQWEIAKKGERIENDNPADQFNTVLKMAKKRSHVDAVLTATAASDCFTQDLEDMPETIPGTKDFKEKKEEPKKSKKSEKITEQEREDLFQLVVDYDWPESAIKSMLASYGFENSKDITQDKYEVILKEIEKGYQQTITE